MCFFIECGIDLECLQYMSSEDVNDLIPRQQLGLRIKFKQKLKQWRLENVNFFFTILFYIFTLQLILEHGMFNFGHNADYNYCENFKF